MPAANQFFLANRKHGQVIHIKDKRLQMEIRIL